MCSVQYTQTTYQVYMYTQKLLFASIKPAFVLSSRSPTTPVCFLTFDFARSVVSFDFVAFAPTIYEILPRGTRSGPNPGHSSGGRFDSGSYPGTSRYFCVGPSHRETSRDRIQQPYDSPGSYVVCVVGTTGFDEIFVRDPTIGVPSGTGCSQDGAEPAEYIRRTGLKYSLTSPVVSIFCTRFLVLSHFLF